MAEEIGKENKRVTILKRKRYPNPYPTVSHQPKGTLTLQFLTRTWRVSQTARCGTMAIETMLGSRGYLLQNRTCKVRLATGRKQPLCATHIQTVQASYKYDTVDFVQNRHAKYDLLLGKSSRFAQHTYKLYRLVTSTIWWITLVRVCQYNM